MGNYGISIRCTEAQAERLANEIRQMGYIARVAYDIGERYAGEKAYPAHWLLATVMVRGFEDEEIIETFIESFGLCQRGRCPFLYQLKGVI